jgi:hypothetical protein
LTLPIFDRPGLEHLYREIFVRQYYYFRANTDHPVIFDCGANLGMATLFFKWLYPKSRVEAFEPDPGTFAVLQKNVDQQPSCLADFLRQIEEAGFQYHFMLRCGLSLRRTFIRT